jgi:5-methylcytosine-specific restriction endonuclease McrA
LPLANFLKKWCYNLLKINAMHEVLVLNANFEPVNVCNIHRALGLMITDKATLILNGRGEIHTATAAYPCPSIIRLQNIIHRPRPHVTLTRREVLRRDNFTCQYCGKHTVELTIDHIIPRHMEGMHVWGNVVAACPSCNHRKGGRRLEEAGMHLLRRPVEPPASAAYLYGRYLHANQEWEPFLKGW